MTLNPSRNTLPLANHTKIIDVEHTTLLGNTITEIQKNEKGLHLIKVQSEKEYICNPFPLSLENPKLDVNLENLRSNMSN